MKHIQVINADSSLSHLNILLTNSLRSIELVNLTDSNKEVFSSFLITLADECPRLSSISLGQDPGRRLSSSLLTNCLKFSHLCELELKDVLAAVDFELLVTIGQALPALESFILNARTAKYSSKPLAIPPTPPQLIAEERSTDGSTPDITVPQDRKDDGFLSGGTAAPPLPVMAQSSFAASSSSPQAEKAHASSVRLPHFLLLKKLHVTGKSALIRDLVRFVGSTVLEYLALTLVRSTPSHIGKWGKWKTQQLTPFTSVIKESVHTT